MKNLIRAAKKRALRKEAEAKKAEQAVLQYFEDQGAPLLMDGFEYTVTEKGRAALREMAENQAMTAEIRK